MNSRKTCSGARHLDCLTHDLIIRANNAEIEVVEPKARTPQLDWLQDGKGCGLAAKEGPGLR